MRDCRGTGIQMMAKKFASMVVGLVAGVAVIRSIEMFAAFLFPPPLGIDFSDPDALTQFMDRMPAGAFILVLLAHATGSFAAGFSISAMIRKTWWTGPLVVGALLNLAGIANLILLPHPAWFACLDLPLYLPLAWLGARTGLPFFAHTPPSSPGQKAT